MHLHLRKRNLLIRATAVAALGFTTTVSSTAAAVASTSPPITVTYWTYGGFPMVKQVESALDRETGEHIVIDVRSVISTSYDSVLTTAMDAGTGPDVFKDRAGTLMQEFAAAKLISPLNGKVSLSHFGTAPIDSVTYDARVWGVPQVTEEMVAFYNKAIFSKLHLSVPSTWGQFITDLATIKAAGITPVYMMGTQAWLVALDFDEVAATIIGNANAAEIVAGKANFTSPPFVKALTDFQQMGKYLEPDWQAIGAAGDEQEVQFGEGHAAVIFDGLFDLQTIQSAEKDAKPKFKIGEFLVPGQTPTQQPMLYWYPNGSYALNSKITDPQVRKASIALLKYMSTPSYGKLLDDYEDETDAMSGVSIPKTESLLGQAYTWFEQRPADPIIGVYSKLDLPPVNSKDIGIFQAEQNVIVPFLQGKMTPKAAASSIQKATAWYFAGK